MAGEVPYMNDCTKVESKALSSTTSATFQNKVTFSTGTRVGTYRVKASAIINNAKKLNGVRLQNITDTLTLGGEGKIKANNNNALITWSMKDEIVLTGVNKDLVIQWKDNAGGNSQGIRDAIIELYRIL